MMKRALSFLLCLIMVFSIAVPTVQATGTDDIYISDGTSLNDIIVGDNVQMDNVVIDGNSVSSTDTKLPSPTQLVTDNAEQTTSPVFAETEEELPETDCSCADLASAEVHPGVCLVKVPYIESCEDSVEEIFDSWSGYSAVEQAFLLDYMAGKLPEKYNELQKLLNAPTGAASETLVDGTTVSVQGIPEDGTLVVGEATDEVKDIVDAYVGGDENPASELFTYDVSIQDADGADWQPDVAVKMELEVPGVKLHKLARVYVVHVDDEGVASTIEAQVTEDGKIVFETPGFSTFAGFTVDFEFEGVRFCIPGLTSTTLSNLFTEMEIPLFIEDVANVEFSNYDLISVEKQEDGDWLLTSLQAFQTTEALTLTMNDGTVHVVTVTDAIEAPTISFNGSGNLDDGTLGAVEWYLYGSGDGKYGAAYRKSGSSYAPGWTEDYDIYIDGTGATNKTFEIVLQRRSDATGTELDLDIHQIHIKGGANVIFRFGASITNANTTLVRVRQVRGYDGDTYGNKWWFEELFWVEDGSLELKVPYVQEGGVHVGVPMRLTVDTGNLNNPTGNGPKALVSLRANADYFKANQVHFHQCHTSAIVCRANSLSEFTMKDCRFASDCYAESGQGGAIYVHNTTEDNTTTKVDIGTMTLDNVEFYKNEAKGGRGGAVLIRGNVNTALIVTGCKFTQNSSTSHGGAIEISNNDSPVTIGAATFTDCTFSGTKAGGNRGGAIRAVFATATPLTISGCSFTDCSAGSHGGAVSVQGKVGKVIVNSSTTNATKFLRCSCANRGGAITLDCSSLGDIELTGVSFSSNTAGTLGGAVHVGRAFGADETVAALSAGSVTVSGCTFSGNTANGGIGGGICLTDGQYTSASFTGTTFSNCYSNNFGGAICLKESSDGAGLFGITGSVNISGCSFTNCSSGSLSLEPWDHDGDSTTDKSNTWDHDGDPTTAEIYRMNGTGGGGAIAIGGTIGTDDGSEVTDKEVATISIVGTDVNNKTSFGQCYTWNNGGAIFLHESLKTRKMTLQYLNIDGCRGRDAGNAVHISTVTIRKLYFLNSIVQNCAHFTDDCGIAKPIVNAANQTYLDAITNVVDVYKTYDASGTFRSIGNTTAECTIDDVQFLNNTSYSNGGGVYWNANRIADGITPSLTLKNSTFDGNRALRDGGGLYCEATVDVDNCKFYNNIADERGGAIAQQVYSNEARTFSSGEKTNLILDSNTLIYSNTANHGGGISITVSKTVSVPDGTNVIYPVQFQLGGASVYENHAYQNGGGIYYATATYEDALEQREVDNFQKMITIDNGKIYSNIAGYYDTTVEGAVSLGGSGGGVYMSSNQVNTGDGTGYSQVSVSDGAIYDNKAIHGNGGGIFLNGINALCTVSGGAVGAKINDDKSLTASPNSCTDTVVDSVSSGGNGGGIAVFDGARIEMTGGDVVNNTSTIAGGGIAVHNGATMYISSGNVKNNSSSIGGGISLNGSAGDESAKDDKYKYGMLFDGGYVCDNFVTPNAKNNNFALGGGICISNSSTMKLDKNAEITGNIASTDGTVAAFAKLQQGGGIAVCQSSTMTINGGKIAENRAYDGGGMVIRGASSVTMTGSVTLDGNYEVDASTANGVIKDNIASHYGGGVYLAEYSGDNVNKFTMNNGWIYSNEAGSKGGGVYVLTYNGFYLNGGSIEENSAVNGGGVYSNQSVVAISDGVIKQNEASEGGGGILSIGSTAAQLTVTGGNFLENKAKVSGGGVYTTQCYKVEISDGHFEGNLGKRGGGMFLDRTTDATFSGGCVFTKNYSNQGAGIFIRSSKVTIDGGTFSYNECVNNDYYASSTQYGGGILVDNMNAQNYVVTINGGTIEHNKAPQGAGIWIKNINSTSSTNIDKNPVVVMNGGTIQYNEASGDGGGIYVNGNGNAGTDADGNLLVTSFTMNGGTITYNTAKGNGGGVYVGAKAVALITKGTLNGQEVVGTISNNTAKNGGGVFVTNGGELTVNEGHITFNNAVGKPASTIKTGYRQFSSLVGAGGGICVANSSSTAATTKFTLSGTNMAIYGNLADFAADDVFANSYATTLSIPQVSSMNLSGYKFKPEAWFEDYAIDDSAYNSGLMLGTENGITNGNVYRYRGAASDKRILISEANVTSKVNAANTYVSMTLGIPAASDDTVVIDFGLPVKIDVIANDVILSADELKSTGTISASAPSIDNEEKIFEYNGIIYGGLDSNFKENNTTLTNLSHGVATLDKTNGYLKYQINSDDFAMASEDSFYYAVYHEVPTSEDVEASGYYYYGKVTVIPATTIYFEDNFGDAVTFVGDWTDVGNPVDLTDVQYAQGQDRIGASDDASLDVDYLYGYDSQYANMTTHSMNSSKKITVSDGVDGTATFTFTGTGFDIISRCTQNTGAIMVSIYEGDKVDDSKLATTLMVDTFYGCTTECYKVVFTFTNGKWTREDIPITQAEMGENEKKPAKPKEGDSFTIYMAKIIPLTEGTTPLWQVPVINADMNQITKSDGSAYGYGTYTVEVYVAWSWWTESGRPDYEHCDFYLDAVRIYNPANNGVGNTVIQDAYLADHECWPTYQELRNMFITKEEIGSDSSAGAIFVDGFNSLTVSNFDNFGPNNEVYLGSGQWIAFKLDELNYNNGFTSGAFDTSEQSIIDAIHIGIKSLTGNQASFTISSGDITVAETTAATAMYYDITDMKNAVVTIQNTGSYPISITNVKVTHTKDPSTVNANTINLFTVNDEVVQTAMAIVSGEYEVAAPELTLKYPTLSFEGQIRYNAYFAVENLGDLTSDDLGLAVFTSEDIDGTVDTADYVVNGASVEGDLFMVSTNGIAAKNLGDDLYFRVFARLDDGSYVYSDMRSYNAVQYAQGILAGADESQKALVVAMLNYGAEAQKYFNYNADNLMNSFVTAEQQALLSGYNASMMDPVDTVDASKTAAFAYNGGYGQRYPTVSFEGAFQINYYFQPSNSVDGTVRFYYWTEDTYNSVDTLTTENADGNCVMMLDGDVYTAVSGEIVAKELDKTIYVAAVYESDGVAYNTGVLAYSLSAYCQEHSVDATDSMYNFANAAAVYGCAAKDYFAA